MDIDKTLRRLFLEKKRLDGLISRLEARVAKESDGGPKRSTRGRKSMSPEERVLVSARMSAYWAARRAKRTTGEKKQVSKAEQDDQDQHINA